MNLLEYITRALTDDITNINGKYLKIFIKIKLYNISTTNVTKYPNLLFAFIDDNYIFISIPAEIGSKPNIEQNILLIINPNISV